MNRRYLISPLLLCMFSLFVVRLFTLPVCIANMASPVVSRMVSSSPVSGSSGESQPKGAGNAEHATDWKLISDDDGIKVYRAEMEGSSIFAFKGETVIHAPLVQVGSVIIDVTRKLEWLPNSKEAKLVREISEYERLEYYRFKTPPLVSERDFCLKTSARQDPINPKKILFEFSSTEDSEVPETDAVRGQILKSQYEVWQSDDGKSTNVTYTVHLDPKGSLPKWVVNWVQKKQPRETLEGLTMMVQDKKFDLHPKLLKMFPDSVSGSAGK